MAEPYAWLEAMDSPAVRQWAHAQDQHARRFLDNVDAAALRQKILAIANVSRFMPPIERGGHYFYVTVDGGATRASAWMKKGLEGEPELLLEAGTHIQENEILHRQIWPSPEGRWLAYGVTAPASRWMEVRFLDLK